MKPAVSKTSTQNYFLKFVIVKSINLLLTVLSTQITSSKIYKFDTTKATSLFPSLQKSIPVDHGPDQISHPSRSLVQNY